MKILVISLDTYGDQVLRQPLLTALLDCGNEVSVVIRREYADVAPFLDERLQVLECTIDSDGQVAARDMDAIVAYKANVVAALAFNRGEVDRAILAATAGAVRIALVDEDAAEADTRGRPSAVDVLDGLAERRIPVDARSPERVKNGAMFRAITGIERDLPRPRLTPTADAQSRRALLRPLGGIDGPYVVMGGVRPRTLKSLPVDLAVETIEWLTHHHGLSTLLTGVESERDLLTSVRDRAVARGGKCEIYVGMQGRLGDLIAIVAGARAYVGGDTGTMHFAGALDIPVAALFGGGHFPRFQPEAQHWVAMTKRLLCFGCGWRCIYDNPRCIDEVSHKTWFTAVADLLAGQSPGWRFERGGVTGKVDRGSQRDATAIIARYWNVAADAQELRNRTRHSDESVASLQEALRQQYETAEEVERDRALRKQNIDFLVERVKELEANAHDVELDRAARLRLIQTLDATNTRLSAALETAETEGIKRVQALEELTAMNSNLQERINVIEADRAARLHAIEELNATNVALRAELATMNLDRAARLDAINRLQETNLELRRRIDQIETDRTARLRLIDELHKANATLRRDLDAVEQDRAARLRAIETLDRSHRVLQEQLDVVEADRAARLEVILSLKEELRYAKDSAGEQVARESGPA